LTHGGFYRHFASKNDLAAAINTRVFGREPHREKTPSIAEVVR
jgi:AcrR family transcriptional regulator